MNPFLNHWHCVGIQEKINFKKPYTFQVGDLELVLWKNDKAKDTYSTTLNICKHMGSKLDNAKITPDGCMKCPYHGLEYNSNNKGDVIGQTLSSHSSTPEFKRNVTPNGSTFLQTLLYEGKLFWSYKPTQEKPESIPFFNSPDYETSFLEVEMSCSLQDSAYNTMDLLHPEFVHNNLDVENDRLRALLIALDIPHDLEDSNDVEQTEIDSGSN